MTNLLKTLLLSSTVLLPSTAFAQDADTEIADVEEFVVTASRRPQSLNEIGASISVISAEKLQRGQYNFVLDALQTVPGVAINQNGGFGGQASVSIRGATSAQTVILIDGVQMNDVSSPGGAFNFGTLDTAGIERIEVLRGPQAVLYGSDAIGGVVNIITKTGGGDLSGSAFAEYGAFDTYRAGATLSGGSDKLGFNLSASGIKSDGISKADEADGNTEADGYESYTLRGRITSELSETLSLEAFGSYNDSETDTDSFGPVDGPDQALSEDYLIGGRVHLDLLDGKFTNTLSAEYSGIDRASVSAFGTFPGKGRRVNLDYIGIYSVDDSITVSAGAQHENVKASSASEESFSIDSVFGALDYTEGGFNLSLGMRHDDHESYGTSWNGQARLSYLASTGTRFFANWGEGFKAPSVFQLTYICGFCGLTEPNTNLVPETSTAWELGVEQSLFGEKGKLRIAHFNQDIDDLIDFSFTAGYDNLDSAKLKGLEVGLDLAFGERTSLTANYTYTSAKDATTDERLIRRPKHQIFAALDVQVTEKFSTNIALTHNGAEVDSFDWLSGDPVLVEAWTRVDFRAAFRVSDHIELYGRIDNLFDNHYQQVLGYGTPGISSFFGVRGSF
jgi:vitamin B12 transporter